MMDFQKSSQHQFGAFKTRIFRFDKKRIVVAPVEDQWKGLAIVLPMPKQMRSVPTETVPELPSDMVRKFRESGRQFAKGVPFDFVWSWLIRDRDTAEGRVEFNPVEPDYWPGFLGGVPVNRDLIARALMIAGLSPKHTPSASIDIDFLDMSAEDVGGAVVPITVPQTAVRFSFRDRFVVVMRLEPDRFDFDVPEMIATPRGQPS